jgi:glutamate synthase (NADPH) small chain
VTDPRGFLTLARRVAPYRPVAQRRSDWAAVRGTGDATLVREQARRCMDCGVPFCHSGCPLGNLVPDWNDLVERGRWRDAAARLHETNNFPEWTGALCPAPCEEACVLTINDDPVTIKQVEFAIAEQALREGLQPAPPAGETGRRVAVVGSGPAGLAAAQQLRRAGHTVTVYERDDKPGGLLRYGIPDFKLEKTLIDHRLDQLAAEGVVFETATRIGADVPLAELRTTNDAVVLCVGAQRHRDLPLPGRDLAGIEFAMPYLVSANRRVAGLAAAPITASAKHVVILGGGDTSADCLGCAVREGAASITELAHGPTPPAHRQPLRTWPQWPALLRTYAAHEEGGDRVFGFEASGFVGRDGRVSGVTGRRVAFPGYDGVGQRPHPVVVSGDDVLPAELVLLAIGFAGVEEDDPVMDGVACTSRGTIATREFQTRLPGVFAAGDCVRGADLIVTAIADGRACAAAADRFLAAATYR